LGSKRAQASVGIEPIWPEMGGGTPSRLGQAGTELPRSRRDRVCQPGGAHAGTSEQLAVHPAERQIAITVLQAN
jgi:hypothetical protein